LPKKAGEKMARTIILLLDSFGIGYAHDAEAYGDKGADTLGHICDWLAKNPRHAGEAPMPLHLPHLAERGLQAAAELSRGEALPAGLGAEHTIGAYTYAQEVSRSKDTLSGHWEISGVPVKFDWGYFPDTARPRGEHTLLSAGRGPAPPESAFLLIPASRADVSYLLFQSV